MAKHSFKATAKQARNLWIKALRSGSFKQTSETLGRIKNRGKQHCCLGVACELFNEHEAEYALAHKTLKDGRLLWGRQSYVLPERVRIWLGLSSTSGGFAMESLAGLNDDGQSFKAIARVIAEEPEGLLSDKG